jgi:hypothetical protein
MSEFLPLFLNLTGRDVLLVGGGRVAAAKLQQLLAAGARVRVVAPEIADVIRSADVRLAPRPFVGRSDAWPSLRQPPRANREVAGRPRRGACRQRVDDPANATAFLSGVVRRDGVTVAISTSVRAALTLSCAKRSTRCPGAVDVGVAGAHRACRVASCTARGGSTRFAGAERVVSHVKNCVKASPVTGRNVP